jgi:hypothetical protein
MGAEIGATTSVFRLMKDGLFTITGRVDVSLSLVLLTTNSR